jgi:cobalt transporter subunit CbtB
MAIRSVSGASGAALAPAKTVTLKTETLKTAFLAFFLGLGLVYVAGFAYSDTVHDAAHDSRHALSFPCH